MIQFATENYGRGRRTPRVSKVFVDGRDVTSDCTAFDPDLGLATLINRDSVGRPQMRGRGVSKRIIRGKIEVEYKQRPAELAACTYPIGRAK